MENMIGKFKNESIEIIVSEVAKLLECSEIEAISKMQSQCVKNSNEELLSDLCEYKWKLIKA